MPSVDNSDDDDADADESTGAAYSAAAVGPLQGTDGNRTEAVRRRSSLDHCERRGRRLRGADGKESKQPPGGWSVSSLVRKTVERPVRLAEHLSTQNKSTSDIEWSLNFVIRGTYHIEIQRYSSYWITRP